ncbi:hypothetical protein S2091_2017 [Solimicrobium silvestre]|uniref:Uncharacterized protein n=1 Tax=Solimicrobium silvestre TaxID=2099400 RepID=A0A2S9GZW7_9BURK|nr:hypothetical protein S2091_2017 [Solimicrobium silvestre]
MQPFFHDGDKNICGDGNLYLGFDGVFAGSQKGFDTQMLFDPFEEQFDLPALLVQRGDQFRFERKIVGQEYEAFSVLVFDDNAPQRPWIILACVIQRQLASLVANEIGAGSIDRVGVTALEFGVALGSGYKESVQLVETMQPFEIQVAAIHQIKCTWLDSQIVQNIDFVGLAVGDMNKGRDRTTQVEQSMQFDCSFGGAKRRPWMNRQTQIDCGCIEGIHSGVQIDSHRFVGIQRSSHRNQMLRKIGINLPRTSGIRIRQRVARNGFASKSHVVKPVRLRPQIDFDVAQGFSVGQLSECHSEELIQTRKILDHVFAPVRRNASTKRGQWQISHDLRKNEFAMMHSSVERKSAKSTYFAPRRSNRDQTNSSFYASKSLTYKLLA